MPEVLRHDESKDTSMVLSDKKEPREHKVQKAPNVGIYLGGALVRQAPGLTSLTGNLETNEQRLLKIEAKANEVQELLQKMKEREYSVYEESLTQSQNRK